MARLTAAVILWCIGIASALVAATSYWAPLVVSLGSAALYVVLVIPYWRASRRRVLLAVASLPLAVLTTHNLSRIWWMLR